mmetsp:Transcript_3639/g.8589  ORF Transcript_3639/g.8589 Transcript_3639/m.8589 type:complete len:224 (+) Transcript_3639:712-1383(+)
MYCSTPFPRLVSHAAMSTIGEKSCLRCFAPLPFFCLSFLSLSAPEPESTLVIWPGERDLEARSTVLELSLLPPLTLPASCLDSSRRLSTTRSSLRSPAHACSASRAISFEGTEGGVCTGRKPAWPSTPPPAAGVDSVAGSCVVAPLTTSAWTTVEQAELAEPTEPARVGGGRDDANVGCPEFCSRGLGGPEPILPSSEAFEDAESLRMCRPPEFKRGRPTTSL